MKRKAAIARSLIHEPKFLVYDEATSGLDPMTSRFIADYLRTLKKGGQDDRALGTQPLPGRGDLRQGDDLKARKDGGIRHHEGASRAVRLVNVHNLLLD